jgi:hypothetical protein
VLLYRVAEGININIRVQLIGQAVFHQAASIAEKKVIEAVGGLDPPEHSQQRRVNVDSDSDEDNNSFE